MKRFIGFKEALDLTLSSVSLARSVTLPLDQSAGSISSKDVVSKVDCPSTNTSLRDGYAVISDDLSEATRNSPITLKVIGRITAGDSAKLGITGGQAIKITTGAPIPKGADAVLSEEFCRPKDDEIVCFNFAEAGRNVLPKGTDIRKGETVVSKGEQLSPALIGLMAAAGLKNAPVYKSPRVAVIATGDEVVAPGNPLPEGMLYASNMVEVCSWLCFYGFSYQSDLVGDRKADIRLAITRHLPLVDAFITSGGAWGSERDLMIKVLEELHWKGIYHRVRMGPGKAIGFGLLGKKPFFCLPGGPPSNEMAFLQLALPGLLAMRGHRPPFFPMIKAQLSQRVRGDRDWTQFIHARLVKKGDCILVQPSKQKSRLQSMAKKEVLIIIPEGCEEFAEGEQVDIQETRPFHNLP